jgi:hypothetical protein
MGEGEGGVTLATALGGGVGEGEALSSGLGVGDAATEGIVETSFDDAAGGADCEHDARSTTASIALNALIKVLQRPRSGRVTGR